MSDAPAHSFPTQLRLRPSGLHRMHDFGMPRASDDVTELREVAVRRSIRPRDGLGRRALVVADAAAALIALALVVGWAAGAGMRAWILLAAPGMILINIVRGLYERDEVLLKRTTLDEIPALLQVTALFACLAILAENAFSNAGMTPTLMLLLWIAGFSASVAGRESARRMAAVLTPPERCLVVGDSDAIPAVRSKLEGGGVNAKVVASIRLDALTRRLNADRFRSLVWGNDIHRVILAPAADGVGAPTNLAEAADSAGVRVSLMPRADAVQTLGTNMNPVA